MRICANHDFQIVRKAESLWLTPSRITEPGALQIKSLRRLSKLRKGYGRLMWPTSRSKNALQNTVGFATMWRRKRNWLIQHQPREQSSIIWQGEGRRWQIRRKWRARGWEYQTMALRKALRRSKPTIEIEVDNRPVYGIIEKRGT